MLRVKRLFILCKLGGRRQGILTVYTQYLLDVFVGKGSRENSALQHFSQCIVGLTGSLALASENCLCVSLIDRWV